MFLEFLAKSTWMQLEAHLQQLLLLYTTRVSWPPALKDPASLDNDSFCRVEWSRPCWLANTVQAFKLMFNVWCCGILAGHILQARKEEVCGYWIGVERWPLKVLAWCGSMDVVVCCM